MKKLAENAITLKIVGVIRETEDADYANISSPIAYTKGLTDYLIEYSNNSAVVKAQEESPEFNILNGVEFSSADDSSKVADTKTYISSGTYDENMEAFVAVSLVVSSIMIGIITYISVLERTKEIGILRAIGASKRNISQVFNAETFIIGFCSGMIGIGITLLTLIPANAVIHAVTGSESINAQLPLTNAVALIALSIILTCIGGLIPSKKAAKKDTVTALRSE